jgi:hypothetical protein
MLKAAKGQQMLAMKNEMAGENPGHNASNHIPAA